VRQPGLGEKVIKGNRHGGHQPTKNEISPDKMEFCGGVEPVVKEIEPRRKWSGTGGPKRRGKVDTFDGNLGDPT